jgi:UDP-N-acetylglucosamine 2-epimerase (non-hydrolysing)
VADKYQMPIIFSTHPRTKNRIEKENIIFNGLIQNVPPLGFFDYVQLQKKSFIVLSDSGTISEESAMMNFPAVSIRTSTERPEAIDAGTIVVGGITTDEILNSINISKGLFDKDIQLPFEYDIQNTSGRVIKVIQSYTSIVNKVIWDKQI